MPSTAPETRVSTATIQKGISAHSGRMEISAPIGSSLIATFSAGSDPASSRPKITSTTGAAEPPTVFHATIDPSDAVRFW
eukprot:Nk52_evm1s1874 gene=Nk52_evmTU1s1874